MQKWLSRWIVILIAFAFAFAGAKEPLKIGALVSATGPASFLGDPELKTLKHYVEKINNSGGVDGRRIELVAYDTGANPKKAVTFAKRLIFKDKVDAIVGPSTTGETMAIIPLVEKNKVPLLSMAGGVPIVEPVKPWVFKIVATDRMACEKIMEDMKKKKISKIAMISGSGGFGKSMRKQCKLVADKMGIQILADETYGKKDTDMTAQLLKIKNTPGVQAVLNPGFGQGPAIVAKNYRQLQMEQPLYESHGVASKKFIELAGPAAEGVRLPAAALIVADQLPADDPQKKVLLAYKKKYEAKYGPVSTFGGHAYDALFIAVGAIERAKSTDPAKIRDEIEKTHGFVGTGGVFNMSPTDHLGLGLDAFKMIEVKDGNWKLLY